MVFQSTFSYLIKANGMRIFYLSLRDAMAPPKYSGNFARLLGKGIGDF